MFYVYFREKNECESMRMYNNLVDFLIAIFKTISGSKSEGKKKRLNFINCLINNNERNLEGQRKEGNESSTTLSSI